MIVSRFQSLYGVRKTVKVGAKKIVEECHPAQGAPVPQRQEPLFLTAYVLFFQ